MKIAYFQAKKVLNDVATHPAGALYATAKLLRDEAESMVPNIDPEQVRKLAGWGLTQNDRASFVGWSQSLLSLRF